MTDKTARQTLTDAADVIERNGWIQFAYYDRQQFRDGVPLANCSVCLYGAVNIAVHGTPQFSSSADRPAGYFPMIEALGTAAGNDLLDEWNDVKGRTADEVIALLRTVAEGIDF